MSDAPRPSSSASTNTGDGGSVAHDYKLVSIVAIGSFNPAIFHPEWFRTQQILPEMELEPAIAGAEASQLIVSREFCAVPFRSLRVDVLPDRWSLGTERPDWVKDLGSVVKSIFRKLSHTPVSRVGFNVVEHVTPPEGTADEVLRSWLPCDGFREVLGEDAYVGAVGQASWHGFKASVTLQRSVPVRGALFLAQNFEKKIKNVDELGDLLDATWSDVLERSKEMRDLLTTKKEPRA